VPDRRERPVQRKQVDDRPTASIQVKVIERAQHRLGVRAHRRRERLTVTAFHNASRSPALVRARSLASDLHPPAEVTGLDASRPIPRDTDV
jgi:hypothetical protein